jgi:hypothetical protein
MVTWTSKAAADSISPLASKVSRWESKLLFFPLARPRTRLDSSLARIAVLALVGCLGQVKPSDRKSAGEGGSDELHSQERLSGGNGARNTSQMSSPGSGTQDTGMIPDDSVSVVVAVGRGGRTTISCDDGRTWIQNRIETTPTARCWGQPDNKVPESSPDWIDCDHNSGNTTELLFHNGAFYKGIGWGTDGRSLRSTDGVDWVQRNPSFKQTYMNLMVVNGDFVVPVSPAPFISKDEGITWKETGKLDASHVRNAAASKFEGGSLMMLGDKGAFWSRPPFTRFEPAASTPCTTNEPTVKGMIASDSVALITTSAGDVCRSIDGGKSWTRSHLADGLRSNPIWDGKFFYVWGRAPSNDKVVMFKSANGLDWTPTTTNVKDDIHAPEPVGLTTKGTFVAVNSQWNGGYENQRFWRSTDGITWEALASSAYAASHPILKIVSGVVKKNLYCPGD